MPVSRKRKLSRRKVKQMESARRRQRQKAAGPLGIVEGLMRHQGIKGDPRNWVAFDGAKFIDGDGDEAIPLPEPPVPEVATKIVLVHKRRLAEWVGDELAGYFWLPGLKMRVPRKRRQRAMAEAAAAKQEENEDADDSDGA